MKLYVIEEGTEDAVDPKTWFKYQGKYYPSWGSVNGRVKTQDYDLAKYNRFAKIGIMADDISGIFKENIEADPESMEARCSYACLLMMEHGIRVGNESSAEGYISSEGEEVQTFGVTTLLRDHVRINEETNTLYLHFLGKTAVEHRIKIIDDFLEKWGLYYFKHPNEIDTWLGIDYDVLFSFIRDTLGDGFNPKDFRTFRGNVAAWNYIGGKIESKQKMDTATEANDLIREMVEHVSDVLGNTPGVARSNYIDSRMIDWVKAMLLNDN